MFIYNRRTFINFALEDVDPIFVIVSNMIIVDICHLFERIPGNKSFTYAVNNAQSRYHFIEKSF